RKVRGAAGRPADPPGPARRRGGDAPGNLAHSRRDSPWNCSPPLLCYTLHQCRRFAAEDPPMAHIVCQVTAKTDQLSFTWSDGPAAFAPYHLTGQGLLDFRVAARAARERLRHLVQDYLSGSDDV